MTSLDWQTDPVSVCAGVAFVLPQSLLTLVMDMSSLGLGAHLSPLETQRLWSSWDQSLHISFREVRAVHLAFQAFLSQIKREILFVLTDKAEATFYLNRQEELAHHHFVKRQFTYGTFALPVQSQSLLPDQNKLEDHLSRWVMSHHE